MWLAAAAEIVASCLCLNPLRLRQTYMHGFFMHAKLYARLQSVADPFAYDKWKKEQVKKKIADKRKSRITMQRRLPKVNADLAQQIIDAGDEDAETKSKRKNKVGDASSFFSRGLLAWLRVVLTRGWCVCVCGIAEGWQGEAKRRKCHG